MLMAARQACIPTTCRSKLLAWDVRMHQLLPPGHAYKVERKCLCICSTTAATMGVILTCLHCSEASMLSAVSNSYAWHSLFAPLVNLLIRQIPYVGCWVLDGWQLCICNARPQQQWHDSNSCHYGQRQWPSAATAVLLLLLFAKWIKVPDDILT